LGGEDRGGGGDVVNASRRIAVRKRLPLRAPDAPDDELIEVSKGIVALYHQGVRRRIVALRYPGEMILPGERCNGALGVIPIIDSEVVVVPEVAVTPESLRGLYADHLPRSLAIAYEWNLRDGSTRGESKVAHFLCEQSTRGGYGKRMPNWFTQLQIADATGLTSVHVNRVLHELKREGLVVREKGDLSFPDWPALAARAGFDPAYLRKARQ
jgi:CRP-like cAMP-binding protein